MCFCLIFIHHHTYKYFKIFILWNVKKKKKNSLAFCLLPPKTLYICIMYSPNLPHQQKNPLNHSSVAVLVAQSCPTLWDPVTCSLPGSSVRGILQARILEWISIPFSRGYFWPKDWTQVSCTVGRFFTIWTTGKICSSTLSASIRQLLLDKITFIFDKGSYGT